MKFKNVKSYTFECTSGVPQGGNLAPLFFLIYINDVSRVIKYSNCLLFADDLKICKEIRSVQHTDDLKADIRVLEQWTRVNCLPLTLKNVK